MDSQYADQTFESMEAPLRYFGFDKFDSASHAADKLQISPKWSDAKLRGEFDTLQLFDSAGKPKVTVPYSLGGKGSDLEPFATSYPDYGSGGARQLFGDFNVKFRKIDWIGN